MVMIGNLQYAWTMCVQPMMTWAMPLSGWLIDRLDPRVFLTVAGASMEIAGWERGTVAEPALSNPGRRRDFRKILYT